MRGGAEVAGLVKDVTGGPIAHAKVIVTSAAGGAAKVATDERGAFRVAATPGKVTVRASADGYAAGSATSSAPDTALEVLLTPESVLQGRVLLAGSGSPVEGARVEVGRGDERVVATSDAEGRFRLRGLAPGRYKPTATTAGGWGTTRASVLLGLAETEDVEIAVHAALTLRGRVVGPDGKGCAGATVMLASRANGDERRTRADEGGEVRIDGLFTGVFAPYVTCKDMASAATYPDLVVKDGEASTATWKVETGHGVAGVVVTADGKAVPYARLRANVSFAVTPQARDDLHVVTADGEGRFRMRGLRDGTYELDATSDDAAPPPHPLSVVVDRDLDDVKVVLAVAGGIAGTVVDASGAPASGAGIVLRGPHRSEADPRVPVRPDGTFAVTNLGAGDYHLVVRAGESELRMADPGGKLVTVKAGATTRARLVVEGQKESIHGRVLDDAGNPVRDAFVEAEREEGKRGRAHASLRWGWLVRAPVVTDNDGAFVLGGLATGAYSVRAHRKGGGEVLVDGVQTGTTTTLTIARTGALAGKVRDANGKPPAELSVTVRDTKRLFNRVETFFRTEGTFAVSDLPAGEFTVTATTASGRALAEVTLGQGERKDEIELAVEASGVVSGRLVALDDGAPVPGMYVIAFPAKGGGANNAMASEEKLVSGADGRFRLEHVARGRRASSRSRAVRTTRGSPPRSRRSTSPWAGSWSFRR